MSKTWVISDLKDFLHQKEEANEIFQWKISHKKTLKEEFYLIGADQGIEVDQNRKVSSENFVVTLLLKNGEKVGTAGTEFFDSQELAPQFKTLLDTAKLNEEEAWKFTLSTATETETPFETVYAPVKENISNCALEIVSKHKKNILNTKEGVFNSSELFVIYESKSQHFSTGQTTEEESSKIYSEVCFSSDKTSDAEEFLIYEWAAHPEEIEFKQMCNDSQVFAKASLETSTPKAGSYSVLVNHHVIAQIFAMVKENLHISRKYFGMPYLKKDSEFITDFNGQKFEMTIDPHLDYSFNSHKFDGSGQILDKVLVVKNNQIQENLVSSKFSQLLDTPITTSEGNIVINAEGMDIKELMNSEDEVLEILQFSGLFTNPLTMTFSSEIRLAKLHNNKTGEAKYIKGGSISGSIMDNFKSVRWSNNQKRMNILDFTTDALGYHGPDFALLSDVVVTS